MIHQQGIVKGDAFQKIGSAGFLIAVVLIIVGLTWATTVDLSNPGVALARMSSQIVVFQTISLLMTFGWWAVLMGAAAVRRSITASGAAWANMGFYFMIVGTALWTMGMSLDITYSVLIDNWMAAPAASKELAHNLVTTLFPPGAGFGRGLFPLEVIANWLAFAFLGTAMALSAVYPRWLGWLGLILGIIGVLVGIVMTYIGREAIFMPFTVLAFATILWFLMSGIWMVRRAW